RNPELPAALVTIVGKLLEKDRHKRYQDAADVHRDLRHLLRDIPVPSQMAAESVHWPIAAARSRRRKWVTAASVVGSVVLLALAWAVLRPGHRPDGGPRTIAVLPFEPVGPRGNDYFADGVADEIRGKLTTVSGLRVIARGSSVPYKGTSKTPPQIARELG